jgi:hypothetical protein
MVFVRLPLLQLKGQKENAFNSLFPAKSHKKKMMKIIKMSSFFQTDIQAPLNRQIIQSSETVMYLVKLANNFLDYFSGGSGSKVKGGNDLGSTDNMPRYTWSLNV